MLYDAEYGFEGYILQPVSYHIFIIFMNKVTFVSSV